MRTHIPSDVTDAPPQHLPPNRSDADHTCQPLPRTTQDPPLPPHPPAIAPGNPALLQPPPNRGLNHSATVKRIQYVELGRHVMATWYYSPYPEPFGSLETLFVDEFQLTWHTSRESMQRHVGRLTSAE